MFAKETYVQRRAQLKKTIGSGVLLFLGNDEQGLNYEDNTFRYRQDSTFLYYFGLSFAGHRRDRPSIICPLIVPSIS